MVEIIIYFLPMIFFLGIITSYEDIKFGKIRNKWIIFAIIYGILIHLYLFNFDLYRTEIRYFYLYEILRIILTLLLGFFLWYFKIWSAGDSKLFIAYFFLIPTITIEYNTFGIYPYLVVLFNTFFIGLIYLLFEFFKNIKKKRLKIFSFKRFFSEIFSIYKLPSHIIFLFSFMWIASLIMQNIPIKQTYMVFVNFFFSFLIFMIFYKKKFTFYVSMIIAIFRFFLDESIYSLHFLYKFIFFVLIWRFFFSFIYNPYIISVFREFFSEKIKINKLKKGMVLNHLIYETDMKEIIDKFKDKGYEYGKIKKKYYFLIPKPFIQLYKEYSHLDEEPEGLENRDIKRIQHIFKNTKEVLVSITMPFSLLFFFTVLISIIFKGNLLILLVNLI